MAMRVLRLLGANSNRGSALLSAPTANAPPAALWFQRVSLHLYHLF
jgi:hypothetical protein